MFKAKADIADLSAADVVLSDSKVFDVRPGECVCVGGGGGGGKHIPERLKQYDIPSYTLEYGPAC
jgi:hypothetical protein